MAPVSPDIEYLYDFLYYDVRRITSYLAQLDPDGALTGIMKQWGKIRDSAWSAQGNIGVLAGEGSTGEEFSKTVERSYDPAWSVPIAVLNRLDELAFIERDLTKATIGRLVLIEGQLSLIDIRMLRAMWPAILSFMDMSPSGSSMAGTSTQTRQQRRAQDRQKEKPPQAKHEMHVMKEVVQHLPHTIQMHMMTSDPQHFLWGTLSPDHMVMNPDDLALKHGASIPGSWYVLAVLDAYPIERAEKPTFHEIIGMTELARGMYQLLMQLRPNFGRPGNAYGVMPLLVFRTVKPGG